MFNNSRETKKNGFLDLENVGNEEISKIYKTQSSVPLRTYKTGSWPGFSRLPEHNSFVKLQKNGFLDLENVGKEEISKIHKTQSSVPLRTCETGSWPGLSRSLKHGSFVKLQKNGFLDLENVGNEEISKIHKTQSSVPLRTCKTGSWPGF